MNALNQDLIKKATDASHTATITMIALGFRQRARQSTTLSSVKSQLTQLNEVVVEKDFFTFWKNLETAGAGSLIIGRRGRQTRFAWNYSLKHIAQVAIEGKDKEIESLHKKMDAMGINMDSEPAAPVVAKVVEAPKPKRTVKPKNAFEARNIEIRPNFSVHLVLPTDITDDEMKKLKEAL